MICFSSVIDIVMTGEFP